MSGQEADAGEVFSPQRENKFESSPIDRDSLTPLARKESDGDSKARAMKLKNKNTQQPPTNELARTGYGLAGTTNEATDLELAASQETSSETAPVIYLKKRIGNGNNIDDRTVDSVPLDDKEAISNSTYRNLIEDAAKAKKSVIIARI